MKNGIIKTHPLIFYLDSFIIFPNFNTFGQMLHFKSISVLFKESDLLESVMTKVQTQ